MISSPAPPIAISRAISDRFQSFDAIQEALRDMPLNSSNTILGIDYSVANKTPSGYLHTIKELTPTLNPYQDVLCRLGRVLAEFDDDHCIPVLGFGAEDKTTKLFSFIPENGRSGCKNFDEVLRLYQDLTPTIKPGTQPMNLAPVIHEAIMNVKREHGFHMLIILVAGQVTEVPQQETIQAIVEASKFPISIIVIGVGDGPWDNMKKLDDDLPQREFDNFQFVKYHDVMNAAHEYSTSIRDTSALSSCTESMDPIDLLFTMQIHMSTKVYHIPSSSKECTIIGKKRKMDCQPDASTANNNNTGDATRENAKRRWRLLQKHVCITQWLSKDLMRRHLQRFNLAQQVLADAIISSNDDFMDVFVKVREQFLSLLDAENCFLSFEANRSILEFDGRHISVSTRAKTGLLGESLRSGHHVHLANAAGIGDDERVPMVDGITSIDMIRSYICIPLVDGNSNVQAVAEIFNSRYDAKVIDSWLSESKNGSLHIFQQFVGRLVKGFAERSNINEITSTNSRQEDQGANPIFLNTSAIPITKQSAPAIPNSETVNDCTIESMIEFIHKSIDVELCFVYAYDKQSDMLWLRFSDISSSCWQPTVKYGEGIIGKVAQTKECLQMTTRTCSEQAASEEVAQMQGLLTSLLQSCDSSHGIRDILIIPTFDIHEQLNGLVVLQNKNDLSATFTEADVALSVNIGRHIGNALYSSGLQDTIHKAQGKAQTLLDLSAVLFRELETNSLILAIMDAIKAPMNASKCSMFIMNEEKTELYSPVGSDIMCDLSQNEVCISATSGIIGAAAQSGEIINIRDAYGDPRFNQDIDKLTGYVTRSILAIPIKDANGSILGVLEMVNKMSKQYFDRDDEELARGIAYYLAIALNNARLFEEARSAMRRSDALLTMIQVISSTNENVSDVFTGITDTVCQILNVEHGALFFVDALSKTLSGRVGSNWKGYTIPIGKYIPGRVAANGDVVNLVNATADPDFDTAYDQLVGIHTKTLLCFPIKSSSSQYHNSEEGPVIAVFYAANKKGKPHGSSRFCADDLKMMRAICTELSSIIERRAWELVFETTSETEGGHDQAVTSSFLSQYTTTPTLPRRKSILRSFSAPSSTTTNEVAGYSAQPAAVAMVTGSSLDDSIISNTVLTEGNEAISIIQSWELDPWEYSIPQLLDMVIEMFEHFNLLRLFDIEKATMRRFVGSVKAQYHDIPYHNFYHAFSTVHVSFMIVSSQSPAALIKVLTRRSSFSLVAPSLSDAGTLSVTTKAPSALFEAHDLLSIFIAAFCHDMNHNGRTNDFHIRNRTSIAMLYNDQSVLENMHAAACFETMRRPGHDILEHVSPDQYRHMRKSIIRAILATDMHNHAAIVSQLHEKFNRDIFNSADETHKELLINAIVHSADISGPTLAESLHMRWSLLLLKEFHSQYEEELALGMAPTPYMNAQPKSAEVCKLNLAFIDSCVFPLWSIMHTFLDGLDGPLANIQHNRAMWTARLEEYAHQSDDDSSTGSTTGTASSSTE